MPLYTYVCKDCREKFDLLIGVTAEKAELKCKKCSSKNIKKIFGTFSMSESRSKTSSSEPSCPTGTCPTCF
ncbi:MAG: zinc ribbon domain-containing protein [Candidatus Marinimicrobia bacterium]|nr:zinc ribbon domain-containing protein [Candidatus Neomarinimicrobiota bacterium]